MTKTSTENFFIPGGDAFDADFAAYHVDERFEKVRNLMRDRRFTVGETGVASRVMSHWDQFGLLPKGAKGENGGWRKFTLSEMAWLRVIVRMRAFGLSLQHIALATKKVMLWDKKREAYPLFEYYLAKAGFSGADPYVLFSSSGQAAVATADEIETAKLFRGKSDLLLVSLKAVLKDLGLGTTKRNVLFSVTEGELELLNAIRVEKNSEVKTKTDADGHVTEIESTTTSPTPKASHEINRQAKTGKMYGRVVTQYEDGIPVSVQVTKRKRFRKGGSGHRERPRP